MAHHLTCWQDESPDMTVMLFTGIFNLNSINDESIQINITEILIHSILAFQAKVLLFMTTFWTNIEPYNTFYIITLCYLNI